MEGDAVSPDEGGRCCANEDVRRVFGGGWKNDPGTAVSSSAHMGAFIALLWQMAVEPPHLGRAAHEQEDKRMELIEKLKN